MLVSRKLIHKLVEHYKKELGLDHWLIRVHFERKDDDPADAVATSVSSTEYMVGDVFFDTSAITKVREDLELVVRHELIHLVTRRIFDIAHQLAGNDPDKQAAIEIANEQITTHLERMPIWRYARKTRSNPGTSYPVSERQKVKR